MLSLFTLITFFLRKRATPIDNANTPTNDVEFANYAKSSEIIHDRRLKPFRIRNEKER